MAGGRDERVADMYMLELAGDPTEEGQIRHRSNDIVAFVDGSVKSLTATGGDPIIVRTIASNITVVTDTTRLQAQNSIINDGVEVTIEGTGELLVL